MTEEEFIKLIKELFEDIGINRLYKIELMKSGKIKIKYTPMFMSGVYAEETLKRRENICQNR